MLRELGKLFRVDVLPFWGGEHLDEITQAVWDKLSLCESLPNRSVLPALLDLVSLGPVSDQSFDVSELVLTDHAADGSLVALVAHAVNIMLQVTGGCDLLVVVGFSI